MGSLSPPGEVSRPPAPVAAHRNEPSPPGLAQSGAPASVPAEAPDDVEPSPPGLAQSGATMPTVTRPTLVPPAAPYTAPPVPAPGATPFTPAPVPDIDTDVDAGSDVPSGPPLQADDTSDETRE